MTGLPNIRLNLGVPFPAIVRGVGGIVVSKANGVWSIRYDFTQLSELSPPTADYPNTLVVAYNKVTGIYSTLTFTDLQIATQAGLVCALEYVFDAGGQPLQPRIGYLKVPFDMTITEATGLLDQAGSMVFDVWRCTQDDFDPPTRPVIADSLFTTQPEIVNDVKYDDEVLTGVTTRLNSGDILGFKIVSASVATRATLALLGVRLGANL